MARTIHHKSRRNSELFITVHCSQSEERLEYELFGAEGALNRARRGTLFLYEIGDMPLSVQVRLLSELDAGLSTRIIASSTANLGDTQRGKHVQHRFILQASRVMPSAPCFI